MIFLGTCVRPGVWLQCVDVLGLDLGLIEVGKHYQVKEVYITPIDAERLTYKGFPARQELTVSLEGIERVIKPDGKGEGHTFSLRRFIRGYNEV